MSEGDGEGPSRQAEESVATDGDSSRSTLKWGRAMYSGFDADTVNALPRGWVQDRTGAGTMGSWTVLHDASAPSQPNVFAQTSQDQTDYRFPVAVIDTLSMRDVKLSVKFNAIKGEIDQGAGIVWRYRDVNDYYVVRVNALEDNINFYKVVRGRRSMVKGVREKVQTGLWHTLEVESKGTSVAVFYDGKEILETRDDTFRGPGKVGLWTKADSYILFDDFLVQALDK